MPEVSPPKPEESSDRRSEGGENASAAPGERRRGLLVDDRRFDAHAPRAYHPERPERLTAARAAIAEVAIDWEQVAGREATDDELVRVHDARFIEKLEALRGETVQLDPDTYVARGSIEAARLAAGSLVAMVDAMIDGPVSKGVALLRPPGHHARRGQAMGFCLVNSIAVAAAHARARGIARVAIVDWDVHHGNGTQEIFWKDPSVLYVSTHQFPFYPGTGAVLEVGEGDGRGYTINVPLSAGRGDAEYRAAFERIVLPAVEEFAPELVLVSAGFDGSVRDPLAQMELSTDAFGWMGSELARVSAPSSKGRMALVLEGGYDLLSLQAGLASAARGALLGSHAAIARGNDDDDVDRALQVTKRNWRI